MSVAPAGVTNVLVAVSGVLQDPSTYGVVGNTITFSAAPPSGTGNISCRYLGVPVTGVTTTAYRTVTEFTATASQTTFTPPSYTVGFINVYLNGVLLGSADYTATNGTTVVLATGASAGNLVTVESFLVSSVLNAIPNTAGAVGTTNIADNAITTSKIAVGAVIPADLSTGGPSWDTSGNLTATGSITAGGSGLVANASTGNGVAISSNGSTAGAAIVQTQTQTSNQAWRIAVGGGDNAWTTGRSWFLRDDTAGSTRMSVDTSGRVTMPFQPGFFIGFYVPSTVTGGYYKISSPTTYWSVGSGLNLTGGPNGSTRYTAPITGYYFFQWALMGGGSAGRLIAFVERNGTVVTENNSDSVSYGNSNTQFVINLSAGDYLDFRTSGTYYPQNMGNYMSIRLMG